MKRLNNTIRGATVCASLLASTMSFADSQTTWFGQVADGQWLAGVKLGVADPDFRGFSSADTAALVVGYQFSRPIADGGRSSIELELGGSDEANIRASSGIHANGNWDIDTAALYFNYRSAGTVFFKARLGVMDSSLSSRFAGGKIHYDDTNMAGGLGLGFRLHTNNNTLNIETDWTRSSGDQDLDFFSIGALLEF